MIANDLVATHSHRVPKIKHTVVVVDDDAGMKQALMRLLDAAGFKAVTFPSAEACLEEGCAKAECFILDIHLSGLSGFDLRRQLVQSGIKAPVIFITAYDEACSRKQAEEAGAVGYLTKPFPGRTLLELLAKAVAVR
jgi:FixJ family two-component response regulator